MKSKYYHCFQFNFPAFNMFLSEKYDQQVLIQICKFIVL